MIMKIVQTMMTTSTQHQHTTLSYALYKQLVHRSTTMSLSTRGAARLINTQNIWEHRWQKPSPLHQEQHCMYSTNYEHWATTFSNNCMRLQITLQLFMTIHNFFYYHMYFFWSSLYGWILFSIIFRYEKHHASSKHTITQTSALYAR